VVPCGIHLVHASPHWVWPAGGVGRLADHFPFRPGELVDSLPHIVGLGESGPVQPCEGVAHLETSVFDRDGETMPGARATERDDVPAGLEYPVARGNPFAVPPLECCGTFPAVPHLSHEACGRLTAMTNHVNRECPVCAVSYEADPVRLRHGRQTTCSRACSY